LGKNDEVTIEYDEASPEKHSSDDHEEGVEVPVDRINFDTLHNLITEFVTREWEELGDASYTLEQKIEQVRQQMKDGKVKIVFDLTSNTCNIVPSK
jgi:hypothetical protein